jgi:hypothetical protein
LYLSTMLKRGIVTLNSLMRVPSWGNIGKLMVGGAAVQMRSIAQNITFLAVMRAILTMDATGTAAAAHTVSAQMFQLCLIAVLALSTLASILIPQKLNAALDGGGGAEAAKTCADRLLVWGLLLGTFLACVQLAALPALKFFTPLENVQAMARGPVMIGALQVRSRQKFFTHRPVSTFDHVLFQLTDEHSERPRRCRSTVSCSSRRV